MNSLRPWEVLDNHPNGLPVGGCQHPPNGGSSEMHDWGGVHKITGVHGPPQGGVENTLPPPNPTSPLVTQNPTDVTAHYNIDIGYYSLNSSRISCWFRGFVEPNQKMARQVEIFAFDNLICFG